MRARISLAMRVIIFLLSILSIPIFVVAQKVKQVVIEYPVSGNLKAEYTVLKKHKHIKHGNFISYFDRNWMEESSQVEEAGNYVHGKKHGDWKEYDYTGFLLRERIYENGKVVTDQRHGIQKRYDSNNGQRYFDYDKNDWTVPPFPYTAIYPPEARDSELSGFVLVRVLLNEVCETEEIEILESSDVVFDKAAIDGVNQYLETLRHYKADCPNFSKTFNFNFEGR